MSDSGDDGSNSQIVWSGGLGGQHHGQSGNSAGAGGGGRDSGSHGGGGAGGSGGGQQQLEQELATKMLQIQSKRFYLDVKQNRRGRFIKVAEIGADGRRNQIFLALSTAGEFRDHLSAFSDYYSSLGPPNPDTVPEDGKLKSEMMLKDNRRYYLDLKENSRGRFLRVSQTVPRGGTRTQVAIPAQGMIEFRDALTDLLEEFSCSGDDLVGGSGGGGGMGGGSGGSGGGGSGLGGSGGGGYRSDLPEGKHLHVDNKNFYFDIGQNNRGVYMRISEVKTNFRAAITLPDKCWTRFRDILNEYCDKMKSGGGGGSGGGSSGSGGGGNSGGGGGSTGGPGGQSGGSNVTQVDQQLGNGTVSTSLENMGGK